VLDRALEREITLFDTAAAYSAGRSEEILGRWIASRHARDQVVVATKVAAPLTRERVVASAEASLRRLQCEAVDLYQLHSWDAQTPLEETLEALDGLVSSGKVRCVGCSNFAAWQLAKALWRQEVRGWRPIESVQPVYNLALHDADRELLPLCADQQIGIISYSPLGAGFLTGKYQQGGPMPSGTRFEIVPGHQEIYFNEACFAAMERLRAAAAELGLPMARLALAWVLARPGLTATLIGARSPDQVDQVFEAEALARSEKLRERLAAL
jgi:aryl-alcohol dehydrogenase (NADP+)